MSELSQLSPQPLWDIFAEICAIPHPSYHEEALAQHIVDWAKRRKLDVERDQAGNILLRKAATSGMEQRKPVALQAHLDMVAQKNRDTVHDFTRDPIQPYVDGEWVAARNTTLGADNGIGMASALAVLAADDLAHGPLEVLLTMTEEAGMEGAFALQPNWLQAEILINTDAEEEGDIYMGCAGGIDVITTLALQREALPSDYQVFSLTLSGLKGGHSGIAIHHGLGNANKLLARLLFAISETVDLRLLNLNGGTLRNAIPREASAEIAIPKNSQSALQQQVDHYLSTLKNELAAKEPNLRLTLTAQISSTPALTAECQKRLLALLNSTPNGVIRMSDSVPGVVETSLNLGVVSSDANQVQLFSLVRSLIDSGKQAVVETLTALGQLANASVISKGSYPGWQPDATSPVMSLTQQTYQQLFNRTANIMVIHAGLECGLFKTPYPQLDMVSIGPTIVAPHSPGERVHIASVAKYWALLTALLAAIPERK
ncbi:aminoacyl-histidine dipeptidase [Serratia microhaemolytica]|uniref:aminoacyl-histidine dipeptidase n=1 Tax=Serratia microhaemolytica TaxID=2675110 RepID=UPI000FDF0459|nr:aminoacyl-histidine dipeptidase [Serratia microhaemolytica]